jgi:hypothetical protein
VFSKEDKPGNFVFAKDSAGLGVPRGSLGSLHKISNEVGRHGSASMPVYADAFAGVGHGAGHEMNRGPVTLRQASPTLGAERGEYSSAARQGSYGQEANRGSAGSQGAPSFHGGGAGPSAPSSGGSAGGGAHGGASPK